MIASTVKSLSPLLLALFGAISPLSLVVAQSLPPTAPGTFAPPAMKLAYYQAEAQYQAENYHQAQTAFQSLLDSFSTPDTKPFLVGALYRLSQLQALEYTYIDEKNEAKNHQPNIPQALYFVETGLAIQPNHIDLLFQKANLEYNHNKPLKAAKTFQTLCTLDPHSFTFHHFAAIALSQTLKGPEATNQAKALLIFCDTWETHLGNTEKLQQFRQLANDHLQIQEIKTLKNNPNNSAGQPAPVKLPALSAPNKYRKFLALSLEMHRYQEAHIWADSLESVAPIFSAHNLVNAFSYAYNNQWELAQAETANSQVETDPFILNQYLRISARIASHQAQQHPNFGNPKLPETEAALNLWIDLHQREGLSPNDLPFAISIADQAHSVQYLTLWKQMAQDLKTPPTQK